uniref:At2g35280-like TPR domain-containing protein n=1 Tax=Brassica oleracea var. oleracea TaxID=109376 RepID=A0A0D3CVS0_BRAOL
MGSDKSVNNYIDISDSSDYEDYSNSDPTSYFRNISLRYFVAEPFEMLTKHARFKELCLENDNPEAHYIEGLLQYFVHKEKRKGLFHIRHSATLNNTNGMYLYGLLMLALGHYPKGKKYLDKLQWKEKLSTSDHCWESFKNSLSSIPAIMKNRYYENMVNLKPERQCDLDNMAEVCKHCYYFKRLNQFVQFAINKE